MTQVQDTSELITPLAHDNHQRLEAAISAWKSSVSDAHASLTSRLLQTHELLDCLVKAFAERQDRSNAAMSAWSQVEDLRAELAERDRALAAASNLTTDQARRLAELEAELQAALAREAAAPPPPDAPAEDVPEATAAESNHAAELEQLRQQLAALHDNLRAAHEGLEAAAATAQQQAQWKSELAQELAAESRARALLEDECEELRAENAMLRRANESLSHEVSVSRPGGKTTYPFRIYDESGQKRRLGEMLVDAGYLTPTQLGDALVEQESIRETRLGTILVSKGLVREDVVAEGIALQEAS